MERLDIRLLGPPQIDAGGVPVDFDTRKAVAILARLGVEGPQRRETLAALLWPESDATRARGALRRTLSTLRGCIDGAVSITRDEVRLTPGAYECDIDRFRDLAGRPRSHHARTADVCPDCVEQLAGAVALHRGDFLAGFSLRDSADFDDWQFLQAEAVRTELRAALDLLVNALAHHGRMTEAVGHVRRRLALDPLHEPTHRRLMLLHAWTRQREDAIRQYRECVRILENELGVAPLEETTRLYQSILAGQPPPPPTRDRVDDALESRPAQRARPSPAAGSPDEMPMVGRRSEFDHLVDLHRSCGGDGRLVVIEGEAGVGKTRLLDEFTTWARNSGAATVTVHCYPGEEGLAYGPIADALRSVTVGRQDRTIARSWLSEVARLVPELLEHDTGLPAPSPLGSPEADRRFFEGVRQVLTALGSPSTPAVVAIEDLQWADAATRDVVNFLAHRLQASPLCLVLTWRTEEVGRDHPLRRLLTDPRDVVTATHIVLDCLDVDEVVELARNAAGDGELGVRLFRETEGLPLLAVEYLRTLGSGDLDDEAGWTLPAGVRDLHLQRLGGLTETARQVLTSAAVLGHSFGFETLLYASGRSQTETVEALDELLATDILTEAPSPDSRGEAIYDFRHHTLRAVVYEGTSIARRRLLHGRTARSLQRRGRTSGGQVPLAVVAEHLRLAGEEEEAAQTFAQAGDQARVLAAHADAVGHYRAALALGHPDPPHLHESIGDVLTLLGDYRGALTDYQASAARGVGPEQLARLEQKIAGVHERLGDWSAAEAHLEAARSALSEEGDPNLRAQIEAELSLTAQRRGATDEACARAERSLRLAEGCGAVLAAAQAHNILGIISRSRGDLATAVDHLQRSVQIAEQGDEPAPKVAALNNLALVYADQGHLPAALELAKTALAQCRNQGDRHREAAILNNLADMLRAAGQNEEAMRHLKAAVRIFAEIGEPDRHAPEIWKLVDW